MTMTADGADAKAEQPAADADKLFQQEKIDRAAKEQAIADSWSKKVLRAGQGRELWKNASIQAHITGRLHSTTGTVFENSRDRGVPKWVLLGRGSLVPALDIALQTMCVGECSQLTVAPDGGYGTQGSIEFPRVPGSATLVYEVEILSAEVEEELWEMEFAVKMRLAAERKDRGNTLFRKKLFEFAASEYQEASRYLAFMPHPKESEAPQIQAELVTVNLNLAATRLRMGHEDLAINHCKTALKLCPKHPKAEYRLGQAHVQLGNYQLARKHLELAEIASAGDEAAVKSVHAELRRLDERVLRHKRQRKKVFERMVSGAEDESSPEKPTELGFSRALKAAASHPYALAVAAAGAASLVAFWRFRIPSE